MTNSTIELPKMIAELPAPVLANPLLSEVPLSETYMMDCIAGMKEYPDKWFDLAVVDPPYGIGMDGRNNFSGAKHTKKEWDNIPPKEDYWIELFRVSKNQIAWGMNYFDLPQTKSFICWYKRPFYKQVADCELAWTSYNIPAKVFDYLYAGNCEGLNGKVKVDYTKKSIHPTQKPIALYDFCFQFAKCEPGMKVLDTHLGSGSSRIAAHKNKLNFVGFEIDKEYFDKQEKRFANYVCQPRLF